ncbi:hypothetical protein [Undibacterium sp.]|uniref:hypothetical protein n=1 Tax=Undibacterium sp. TaxID=1914977 RepID=UPI0025FC9FC2|nr:hypothetical protein [Undibacterium sp.]
MSLPSLKLSLIALAFAALTACGGNSDDKPSVPDAAPIIPAPGGVYVGYFQEDVTNNPEDAIAGAFVLSVPGSDANSGTKLTMTYTGCQTSNFGNDNGIKNGNAYGASWSGLLDATSQSGSIFATYDPATGYYSGVYSNAKGKQLLNLPNCTQYYMAALGKFEVFPIEKNLPASFTLSVNANTLSWTSVAGTASILVYVLDPVLAQSGILNPIKAHALLPGTSASYSLAAAGLSSGKEYIAVSQQSNSSSARIAFASKRFVAP